MANCQPLYDEFAELLLGIEEAINDTVAEQMRIFAARGRHMERKGSSPRAICWWITSTRSCNGRNAAGWQKLPTASVHRRRAA